MIKFKNPQTFKNKLNSLIPDTSADSFNQLFFIRLFSLKKIISSFNQWQLQFFSLYELKE